MNKEFIILFFILALGFGLRIYQIGINPPDLFADKAANPRSFISVVKTGKDVDGSLHLPYFYFGVELIPPVNPILAGISVLVFGRNLIALRLPGIILGTFSIYLIYRLVSLLEDKKAGLITGFMLSILPWHIHYTRAAGQSGKAVAFLLLSLFLFLKGVKKEKKGYLLISFLSFIAYFYSFRSGVLFSPLIIFILSCLYRKKILKMLGTFTIGGSIYLILLIPFIILYYQDPVLTRRTDRILTFSSGINYSSTKIFISNYISHFSLNFLFINGDKNLRHAAGGKGILYLWMLPFIILGVFLVLKRIIKENSNDSVWIFLFLFFPLGGSLTNDGVPHATRTVIGIPVFVYLTATGINYVYKQLSKKAYLRFFFKTILILVIAVQLFDFSRYYFGKYPQLSADLWDYGQGKACEWVRKNKNPTTVCVKGMRYSIPAFYFENSEYELIDGINSEGCKKSSSVIIVPVQYQKKKDWKLIQIIKNFQQEDIYKIYTI